MPTATAPASAVRASARGHGRSRANTRRITGSTSSPGNDFASTARPTAAPAATAVPIEGVLRTASHTASSNRTMSAVSTWSATRRPAASAITKPFTAWNDAASSATRRSNSRVPISQVSRIAAVASVMDGSRIATASTPNARMLAAIAHSASGGLVQPDVVLRPVGEVVIDCRPAVERRRQRVGHQVIGDERVELLVPVMQRPLPAGIEPQQPAGKHDERKRRAGARGVDEPGGRDENQRDQRDDEAEGVIGQQRCGSRLGLQASDQRGAFTCAGGSTSGASAITSETGVPGGCSVPAAGSWERTVLAGIRSLARPVTLPIARPRRATRSRASSIVSPVRSGTPMPGATRVSRLRSARGVVGGGVAAATAMTRSTVEPGLTRSPAAGRCAAMVPGGLPSFVSRMSPTLSPIRSSCARASSTGKPTTSGTSTLGSEAATGGALGCVGTVRT